jgi:hypothetical protein
MLDGQKTYIPNTISNFNELKTYVENNTLKKVRIMTVDSVQVFDLPLNNFVGLIEVLTETRCPRCWKHKGHTSSCRTKKSKEMYVVV